VPNFVKIIRTIFEISRFFHDGSRGHLGFLKFSNFITARSRGGGKMHHRAKFHQNPSVRCGNIAIFPFLGHLLRGDLINPVKMSVHHYVCPSVRTSVRTYTIKLNPATNQIVVFVKVDESFTTISLSRSSEVRVKVM